MAQTNLNELAAFLAVARARSFTRAAAQLGISQSALSQTVKELEARLRVRLLNRTTRSVSTTEAGERLMLALGPHLDGIESSLAAVEAFTDKPSGTLRITADEHAVANVLWPALRGVLPSYPDISVELVTDFGLTDIVAERFDAGVRLGEIVAKDMIAIPIGPPMRMAAVGSPSYFARHRPPRTPQELTSHTCINLRLPTHGALYAWEFEKAGRETRVRVNGQVVFNTVSMVLQAALDGFGIAYLPVSQVQAHLQSQALTWVLEPWSPPFPGYHLYYPSHSRHAPALAILVDALRYRASGVKD